MDISTTEQAGVTVLSISGSIDSLTSEELTKALMTHVDAGRVRLVANFATVTYTSSAGLRSLLMAVKGARRGGGDMRMAAVQGNVADVLSMAGFTSIIKIFDSVDAAVGSYAS